MEFLHKFYIKNGVYYFTEPDNPFEGNYLAVREKEKRICSDSVVNEFPKAEKANPHYSEWKLREKSTKRVLDYFLKRIKPGLKILDIGCGNGWFTSCLSKLENSNTLGLDINKTELEQASRIFATDKCKFAYGDLFKADLGGEQFDFITLNASVQYFPDLEILIQRLRSLLKNDGEIHIIDSPFYKRGEVPKAQARSHAYYLKLGFEAMSTHYFHHAWDNLSGFSFLVLHDPGSFIRKVQSKLGLKDSPFPWICILQSN